jgi:DMSO/TMAO reductase YedYZ molybdopterin-dependent catalytic subunit
MRRNREVDRRGVLRGFAASAGALLLAGCDELSQQPPVRRFLASAENLTHGAQRLLLSPDVLAPEFSEAEISPFFKPNGSTAPADPTYRAMAESGFADFRLAIGGLVERPASLSLAELRAMPARTQITRHDCVEGWSCIGKWTGVPLAALLGRAGLKPEARYIVFHCADDLEPSPDGSGRYYESIGLDDALHAQTILAYAMNGETLPVPHGAPLRLRVERQLGYKMAKYVMRIEAVADLRPIRGGQGGFWEDRGYEWYAGI